MNLSHFVILPILAGMFLFSAFLKMSKKPMMLKHWHEYQYPIWFMYITGLLELLGVIGIIFGYWYPSLLVYSGSLLILLMLGAIHAHIFRANHKPVMALNAFIMLLFSITMVLLNIKLIL